MTNILFVYERKMATTEVMHEIFCSDDAKRHGFNSKFVNTWKINGSLLAWVDVIVFVRNLDLLSQWILEKAKKKGIFVIQFFDDDVLNLPAEAIKRVQYFSWRKKAIKRGFDKTDLILSSNALLARKCADMIPTHRYATVDTVVDPVSLIPIRDREERYETGRVKIVYAAGANHEDMFVKYIMPIMPELIERFKQKISFTFFGVHPDMSEYEDKVEVNYIGAMSLSQYRSKIQEGYYDIGLAPLESNEFTQYKYFNKYIEYTIAGITGIYSNVLPYTLAVKSGKNGFLADNTPEGWFDAMCVAIENDKLRKSCYRRAYENLITDMSSDLIFEKLKADIPELNNNHINMSTISVAELKARFLFFRFFEVIYLVLAYVRLAGVSGAVKKIKSYIADCRSAMTEKLEE